MNGLDFVNMIEAGRKARQPCRKTGANARTRAKRCAAGMMAENPEWSDDRIMEELDSAGFSNLAFASIQGAVSAARKECK